MEAFTLATCGAICRVTCVEECEQCRFTCVDTHLDTFTFNQSESGIPNDVIRVSTTTVK